MNTAVITRYIYINQGRWADWSRRPLAEALVQALEQDAAFLRANPRTAVNYRPSWRISEDTTLRLGMERYLINDDGTLGQRETNWDSGD